MLCVSNCFKSGFMLIYCALTIGTAAALFFFSSCSSTSYLSVDLISSAKLARSDLGSACSRTSMKNLSWGCLEWREHSESEGRDREKLGWRVYLSCLRWTLRSFISLGLRILLPFPLGGFLYAFWWCHFGSGSERTALQ